MTTFEPTRRVVALADPQRNRRRRRKCRQQLAAAARLARMRGTA